MKPPLWFRVVAILLVLWGIAGVFSVWQHVSYGEQGMPGATDYDRQFYRALPAWFTFVYVAAVGGGLCGAIALVLRSRIALPLFVLSLVAVVVQFGWVFLATDLVAVKGAAATMPFPAFIAAVAVFQLWLASRAQERGWIA